MIGLEPVHLVENADNGARFLIYGSESGLSVELRYEGEALWMTQAQMSELFGRDVSVISRHISTILDGGELDENHLQKMQMNPRGGPTAFYTLDMVISVGYRVSSTQATLFRRWATDKLVQFATKGFVIDSVRLKQPGCRIVLPNFARLFGISDQTKPMCIGNSNRFVRCVWIMIPNRQPGWSFIATRRPS